MPKMRDGKLMSASDWLSREEALEAVGLAELSDVAGELMTPWASPSTDEMGETWPVICAEVSAYF
jgi:hypothetical protein